MKTALFLAVLAVPGMAAAQTARIKTGDHPGFTRIVIDLPAATPWQLGRTEGGYELRLEGGPAGFDLTEAFRIITRDRLATLWTDPETGNLQLGVACGCHAMPFNFRSDIIVIDLRDGPPEAGSAFELALDGSAMPMLAARPVPLLRPRPAPNRPAPVPEGANRLALIRPVPRPEMSEEQTVDAAAGAESPFPPGGAGQIPSAAPGVPFGLAPAEPTAGAQAMRGELLQQLGRAATAGVIDVDDPVFPEGSPAGSAAPLPGSAAAHLAINGIPGLSAAPVNTPGAALTPDGDPCLPDATLDIAAWGDDRPFDAQMAAAREGLLGEFDRPDPEQLEKLVKLDLFFGFGAEARNVMKSFGADLPDVPVWTAMARILDQEPVFPDNPFAGQIACDGDVALWATLAEPVLTPASKPNTERVASAFSALPLHLRRHLGGSLAERMLSVGDIATAQEIRDAIWRAPGDAGPDARLLDARLDRQRGDLEGAAEALTDLQAAPGETAARAMIDLVDTRIAMGQAVDEQTVVELAALAHENQGTALEPPLLRAEALALGSGGSFAAAFSRAAAAGPETEAGLWALLAAKGQDAALLEHAVLAPETPVPPLSDDVRNQIANRLLGLGFPDQALRWLPEVTEGPALVTMARAELLQGDARSALRGIAGLNSAEINKVRAEALERLGDQAAAARAFAEAGDTPAQAAALWRAKDWAASAQLGSEPVRLALEALAPGRPVLPPPGNPPLAQGRALLDESARARDAILALLEATPMPPLAQP